jgi:uncharacterized membrane protein YdbT with pleckstrin-like domain
MNYVDDDSKENLPAAQFYNPETSIIWEDLEGQISNIGVYVLCTLFFWLVIPVFYASYRCILTMCHSYQLTNQRLRESTGILWRETNELELYRVKDISIYQPLMQRLVGRGSIILITSDHSTPRVVLLAIRNPIEVANLLRENVERNRTEKGVRQFD